MYKCNECKSSNIDVEHTYGMNNDGRYTTYRDSGYLTEEYNADWIDKYEVLERDAGEVGLLEDGEIDPENDDWIVLCGNCQREIPFSWGVYDPAYGYGGRIWPLECEEIEGHMYPDPKYLYLVYP